MREPAGHLLLSLPQLHPAINRTIGSLTWYARSPSSASFPIMLTPGQMSLLTNFYLPFKTAYSSSGLNCPWRTPSHSPQSFQHLYTPLPKPFTEQEFDLYLTMSILTTNILPFTHVLTSGLKKYFFFFLTSCETREDIHYHTCVLDTLQICQDDRVLYLFTATPASKHSNRTENTGAHSRTRSWCCHVAGHSRDVLEMN